MIYLHRGLDRAACETEAAAERLEARGYARCSAAVHRALWAIADATQIAERPAPTVETAPRERAVGDALKLPPVYPSHWQG